MAKSLSKMTPRSASILGLLVLLGFLGNFFALPLFYGADFLFGSLAVLLILYFYGLSWGLAAAVAVNSYTYILWGHPYGFIIFTLEALFVGLLLKLRHRNLFLIDGLFWLLIGVPLNGLIYYYILHMGATTVVFVILKQGMNGIFNALLASIILSYIPLHRFLGFSQEKRTVSLQESVFNLLVALILFPTLLFTSLQIRGEKRLIETTIETKLQMLSVNIQAHLNAWYRQSLAPISELAQIAGSTAGTSPNKLQDVAEILKISFPDFHALHVENSAGKTIACSPLFNKNGSTIGINLADRAWFKEAKTSHKIVLSDVFIGERLTLSPIAALCVPILAGNQFLGVATASLDLQRINGFLDPYVKDVGIKIFLIDSQGRVIASSSPDQAPMQIWDRRRKGVISPISSTMYRWSPDERDLASMARWNRSFYVQETKIERDIPWSLVIESPIAPHQKRLYSLYVQNLTVMAVLAVLALILGMLLSRKVSKPLIKLAAVTTDLPVTVTTRRPIDWPKSSITELDSLIGNCQSMTQLLERNFQVMEENSNVLAKTNETLKSEIGERIKAEDALRANLNYSRNLLETSLDPLVTISAAGKVTDANLATETITGLSREALIGSDFANYFTDPDMARAGYLKVFSEGKVVDYPLAIRHASGTIANVIYNASVYLDEQGKVLGVLAAARDVSELKHAEEDKLKLLAQLLQSQKLESLGSLAGGVAHDMNNVLGAILGLASAHIGTQPYGSPLHHALDTICKATERGGKMVKSLLSFARQTPAEEHVLNMNSILREQVTLLERTTLAKISLQMDLEPDLHPIRGDASALTLAIMNLCVNAVDAMPENGTLTLRTRNLDKEWIEVVVVDTGIGMPKEVLARALDPFFTTKGVGKGTGLGLAMVYGTVTAHRGQITLQSEPGHGTRVKMLFPTCETGAEAPESIAMTQPEAPKGALKVFLVDDDELIQSSIQAVLEMLGHSVTTAWSGEEALEKLEAGFEPDLVILDMNMPGLGGAGTLPRLRVLRPTVPVLLSTGRTDQTAVTLASAHSGVTLLSKPFGLRELQKLLENFELG